MKSKARRGKGPVAAAAAKRQKEKEATAKLLGQADELLNQVDESFIMKHQTRRRYPTFERSEIKAGPLLGVGAFGVVFEVKDIVLNNENSINNNRMELPSIPLSRPPEPSTQKTNNEEAVQDRRSDLSKTDGSQTTLITFTDDPDNVATQEPAKEDETNPDDEHYNVATARQHMRQHVLRKADARYAIKRLHHNLTDLERARGMIDLAMEAKYLSVIWHPNIVKMRGIAAGDMLSPKFFILLDRLYETLDEKIKTWKALTVRHRGGIFGIGANKLEMKQLVIEKMIVAYDLAAAFWYLHDNQIAYRDIKQENVGFDVRGDVKVFDFGLCKSLAPYLKNKDSHGKDAYGYMLTPRTGSVPYMAPEVAECKPYDCKCDVFSFAVLTWEIMSLQDAFDGLSKHEFLERVVRRKERLPIRRHWPPLTRLMIKEAWDDDPQKRPDMKRVAVLLRGDLNEMTNDSRVQERTTHMRERSAHSYRLSRKLSSVSSSHNNASLSHHRSTHGGM